MHHVYGKCSYCGTRTNVSIGTDKQNQKQTLACTRHRTNHTPIEMPAPQRPGKEKAS